MDFIMSGGRYIRIGFARVLVARRRTSVRNRGRAALMVARDLLDMVEMFVSIKHGSVFKDGS